MQSGENQRFFEGLKIMARDIRCPIPEEPFGTKIPEQVERCLWNYALGISSSEEQEQVLRWLAVSPRIQQEWTRIWQAMEEAGVPAPFGIPETEPSEAVTEVWKKVLQWTEMVPDLVRSLAVVIVDTAERLLWSQQGPGVDLRSVGDVWVPQPVMMDLDQAPQFPPMIEIRSRNGISVAVDRIAHGNVDLKISVAGARAGETVKLFQIVRTARGVDQRQFADTLPLQEGKARFPECPPGLWKILVSDGREVCLFIEQMGEKSDE